MAAQQCDSLPAPATAATSVADLWVAVASLGQLVFCCQCRVAAGVWHPPGNMIPNSFRAAACWAGGAGEADALLSAEAWRRVRKRHSALPLEDNEREACCRARNAVAVLGSGGCVVDGDSILKIYRASIGDAPSKMLTRAVAQKLVADFLGEPKMEMQQIFAGERFPNIVIAKDGTYVRPVEVASLEVHAGERYDVLVAASHRPYHLYS